jgi:myo-inositol-1(or 4)-monophosphatase
MTSPPLSQTGRSALEVATRVAEEAGRLLLQRFSSEKQINYKAGRANIVTDVDLLVEKHIISILRSEYPEFGILSEESEAIAGDAHYTWIVDPLDGTNNYSFGIPFFCVNIALARGEEVLLSLTFDPLRGETFRAEQGRGAFLNDHPVSVSQRKSVKASEIGCDMGYDAARGKQVLDAIMSLWPNMHGLRLMGSAALGLAYTACGRFDLYLQPHLSPWDVGTTPSTVSSFGCLMKLALRSVASHERDSTQPTEELIVPRDLCPSTIQPKMLISLLRHLITDGRRS